MNAVILLLALALLAAPGTADAHRPSDSRLRIDLTASPITARWDIAVRDLELMLGVDANADGRITWGELRARHAFIAEHALSRLTVSREQRSCRLQAGPQRLASHADGVYSVLEFTVHCTDGGLPDAVEYRLFFDRDPTHRGLLQVRDADGESTVVLSPEHSSARLEPRSLGAWATLRSYWREGVVHIWAGPDHLVFLLTLLLPAVMRRAGGRWHAAAGLRGCTLDVAGVVTAFTAAHSLTLLLSVTGWLTPPPWLVEPVIAATVLLAAVNNLVPVWHDRRWALAFGLGLVHGFGFAGALREMGLPDRGLLAALGGFNLGVETGQVAIVAVFLPLAWLLRDGWFYRRVALQAGSLVIAAVALGWLVERSLAAPWPT